MGRVIAFFWCFLAAAILLSSCVENTSAPPPPEQQAQTEPANLLRIGVSPNYPPVMFVQGGRLAGVEADFARLLPAELNRPVKMVAYPWNQLFSALISGEIDVIMSGVTITKPRQMRMAFTIPYLETGLMTAFRLKDVNKYSSVNKILKSNASVGVIGNTTGEAFVRQYFKFASRIVTLNHPNEAAAQLKGRNIDLFVHDAPSVMWLVSANDAELTGLWKPLDRELLAWGGRRGDEELLNSLNNVLRKWKKDGTIDRVLNKWLPFR
jgi:ABC-type amino acid transport substrate-binding protein